MCFYGLAKLLGGAKRRTEAVKRCDVFFMKQGNQRTRGFADVK